MTKNGQLFGTIMVLKIYVQIQHNVANIILLFIIILKKQIYNVQTDVQTLVWLQKEQVMLIIILVFLNVLMVINITFNLMKILVILILKNVMMFTMQYKIMIKLVQKNVLTLIRNYFKITLVLMNVLVIMLNHIIILM